MLEVQLLPLIRGGIKDIVVNGIRNNLCNVKAKKKTYLILPVA